MEQPILSQVGLESLLRGHDIRAVVEYLSSKSFLVDQERLHINSLKTKQEIVSYLHDLLKVDFRFDVFLDEIDVFTREYLSVTLNQILELKKQKRASSSLRIASNSRAEIAKEDSVLESASLRQQNTVSEATDKQRSESLTSPNSLSSSTFDHIAAGHGRLSQDTGYQSSHFPSAFSVQSGAQETLPSKSKKDFHDQLEKKLRRTSEPAHSLPNSASVVSITNNNYYLGPKPFQAVQPSPFSFPPQPIEMTQVQGTKSPQSCLRSCDYRRRTQWFEDLLKKYSSELIRTLNVDSLLPHLQREELLTTEEWDILASTQRTNSEKKRYLLSLLPSKGESAYDRFVNCLSNESEHKGHADLVQLLTSERQPSNRVSDV